MSAWINSYVLVSRLETIERDVSSFKAGKAVNPPLEHCPPHPRSKLIEEIGNASDIQTTYAQVTFNNSNIVPSDSGAPPILLMLTKHSPRELLLNTQGPTGGLLVLQWYSIYSDSTGSSRMVSCW